MLLQRITGKYAFGKMSVANDQITLASGVTPAINATGNRFTENADGTITDAAIEQQLEIENSDITRIVNHFIYPNKKWIVKDEELEFGKSLQ